MTSHGFSLKRCILDAIFSGLIALIIFGPIAGVVLDGYSFNFAGQTRMDSRHRYAGSFSAERFFRYRPRRTFPGTF